MALPIPSGSSYPVRSPVTTPVRDVVARRPTEPAPTTPSPSAPDAFTAGAPNPDVIAAQRKLAELVAKGPPKRENFPVNQFGNHEYEDALGTYSTKVNEAEQRVKYESLLAEGAPKPDPRKFPVQNALAEALYKVQVAQLEQALAPGALANYERNLSRTPTGQALLDEARSKDVPIQVLPDAVYQQQFPGTGSATTEEGVFVPFSAVRNLKKGVLERELGRALLGGAVGDLPATLPERAEQARKEFKGLGLSAEDGERFARSTRGWSDSDAAIRVQIQVNAVDIEREFAGLPKLTSAERDALYEAAAEREAALSLKRKLDGGELSLAEAEQAWARLPQGQAHPADGKLARVLKRLSNEERVNRLAFPENERGSREVEKVRRQSVRG